MKNIKFTIKLFMITVGLTIFFNSNCFAATGKSTAVNVRVRESASTTSEIIELLDINDKVEILEEDNDWYKIIFNKKTGYVSKAFIQVSEGQVVKKEEVKTEENTTVEQNTNKEENKKTEENNSSEENIPTPNIIESNVYSIIEDTQLYILPVLTSEVIGNLKKAEEITVINNAGLWAYISTSSINGWVRIDKLTDKKSNVENKEENQPEKNVYAVKDMYVKPTVANIREQANTSSDIITSVNMNTQVKVVDEQDNWYKVEVSGKVGFIRKDLLSDKKVEVSSRSDSVDRTVSKNETATKVEIVNKEQTVNVNTVNTNTVETKTEVKTNTTSAVTGNDIVEYAKKFLGCKYVYGAVGPKSFDCSGFTMYVYKHFGYSLSHSSRVQATQGKPVKGELQPGDILVFTNNGKTVGHVGIYIGNDKFIHASDSRTGVIISNLSDRCNKSKYMGARRIL